MRIRCSIVAGIHNKIRNFYIIFLNIHCIPQKVIKEPSIPQITVETAAPLTGLLWSDCVSFLASPPPPRPGTAAWHTPGIVNSEYMCQMKIG